MNFSRRILVMTVLCFSGGIIFLLPFLREVYYQPMQAAFGHTNTEMGVLMSVFGAFSLIAYFPGGWLADRFPPRGLITGGLLATGLAGFYFATFPSYAVSIAIHAFWGANISLVFWGAMIKATRIWGSASGQGAAFGILESGRGVAEIAASTVFLAIFAWLGSGDYALSVVILMFSATNIFLAITAWFLLTDDLQEEPSAALALNEEPSAALALNEEPSAVLALNEEPSAVLNKEADRIKMADLLKVLKMPMVWLISLVVMTAYSAYWGTFYFTPYASDVFLMSAAMGGAVGVGKMWLKPVAAVVIGFVGDKLGISRTIFYLFIAMTLSFLVFGLLPGGADLMIPMLLNVAVASIAIFSIRGVYFALLEETGIPIAFTGIATGIVSVIGFSPDIFMPLLGGVLLDAYPGVKGYSYLYFSIAGFGLVGILAIWLIMVRTAEVDSGESGEKELKIA
ncbi:MAG TPA: MFS transporter [Pseudomonadales bacterium]|nr:MFS transporter [Pseudomonadales bacterium]